MRGSIAGGEQRDRPAAGDSHTAHAAGVQFLPGRDPVDGPHDVIRAPADHGLAEQQRGPRRRLAGRRARAFRPRHRVAPAAERHRLDGHGRHAVLHHLDGEIVLIVHLDGAVAPLLVDPDDVIHSAAMSRNADHRGVRRLGRLGRQQVAEHVEAGAALEHELFPRVSREVAHLERLRLERRGFAGKAAQQFRHLGAQCPSATVRRRRGCAPKGHAQRRRVVQFLGEEHGIEGGDIDLGFQAVQRAHVMRLRLLGRERLRGVQSDGGRQRDLTHVSTADPPGWELRGSRHDVPL